MQVVIDRCSIYNFDTFQIVSLIRELTVARRSDHSREELYRLVLDTAQKITEKNGLRELKARRIARDIGYTIGTLYNLFTDLDDIIIHMNAETFEALYDACSSAPLDQEPEENLKALTKDYLHYTRSHPKLWSAVFEHKPPDGRDRPVWYSESVARLLSLVEKALASLFPGEDKTELQHHAFVLWTSLFGMAAVESADRMVRDETTEVMVDSLIETYMAGLRQKAGKGI